ncbi:MAG: hypothetical protein HLUCCA11_04375 [Phormidesmis priestleyi Ana]|uniref:Uncharacterized protein n=1 Tax=Phormidesmis priestleyi Ana TaxID=1666911 RepID=A0A0P8C4V2_9CYAN|nr:MAG: hypothetical protein HLUCCA11_04375 [Phormidesmis priestleyi Ana]
MGNRCAAAAKPIGESIGWKVEVSGDGHQMGAAMIL